MSDDILPDIWSLIERHFTSDPDRVALTSTKVSLTYRKLEESITALAGVLRSTLPRSYQTDKKRCLMLHLPNSTAFSLSVLTCVLMKQPFTPLPVDFPIDKKRQVLEDVKGAAILTTPDQLSTEIYQGAEVLAKLFTNETSVEHDIILVYLPQFEGEIDIDNDCCYTIYTSGSTGRPKGVQCLRSGVSNLALGQIQCHGDLSKDDVSAQFASVAYDAVISEIFVAFVSGGTLAVLAPEEHMGVEFEQAIQNLNVTLITLVPSLLEVLSPKDFPTLKKLVTAGEACSKKLARKWMDNGRIKMFNAYGPAENTVCATMYEVTEEKLNEGLTKYGGLPIGAAMRGIYVKLLDENLQEVPQGAQGEIYIGGQSLAKGYIGHASAMTDVRFIPDPTNPNARLYKTGDLAMQDSKGDFTFLGRVDDQIKIHGQMVNMTGVGYVLTECPGVELAVVVCQHDEKRGVPRLVAFLSPKSLDVAEIKRQIKDKLSFHETPVVFKLMDDDQFPRNSSDKIDRKQLETFPLD